MDKGGAACTDILHVDAKILQIWSPVLQRCNFYGYIAIIVSPLFVPHHLVSRQQRRDKEEMKVYR